MENKSTSISTYEEDTSDSLSSGFPNISSLSFEGPPFFPLLPDPSDGDNLSCHTKKIGKKRNAYHKVDDDIRLQLLDAVQKNGETLKAAAKRLGVNYSSAKSVIHTFRKEGRILKKSQLERNLLFPQFPLGEIDINTMAPFSPFTIDNFQPKAPNTLEYPRPPESHPVALTHNFQLENRPASPMRGLTEGFNHLLLENSNKAQTLNEEVVIPKLIFTEAPHKPQPLIPMEDLTPDMAHRNMQHYLQTPVNIPALNLASNQQVDKNPLEALKHLENFYMNYSNSPLSGGNGNMFKESSDSSSRRMCQKEFDSFSELVSSFQSQPRMSDELKNNLFIPKPLRRNDSSNSEKGMAEEPSWSMSLDNAARDTYKNFMDAQHLLSNALKKATLLNNLVQFTSPSSNSNKNK